MPPRPLVEDLGFLLGAFVGTQRVHATVWAPTDVGPTRVLTRVEVGGDVLVMSVESEGSDAVPFHVLNTFMRDSDGVILLYAFDTLGYAPDPPARGDWSDGTLTLDRTTTRGSSTTEFVPTAEGFRWHKTFRAPSGDESQPVFDADLTRRLG